MNNLHLTLLFAGLCALLQCALTALVIARRLQAKVSLLDGGDAPLLARMRAHGNFTETVPMALILMALLESCGLQPTWLWALGICLVLGRVLHAAGVLVNGLRWSRFVGMTLTLIVLSVGGTLCLGLYWR
jgi:uncharacterized protein